MAEDMVESEEGNKSAEKYDFIEFQHAKKVVDDFPGILIILDKLAPILQEKAYYTGVWALLQSVEDTRMLLNMQYTYYKHIYDKKGKIDHGR